MTTLETLAAQLAEINANLSRIAAILNPSDEPKYRYFKAGMAKWKMPTNGGLGYIRTGPSRPWDESICALSDCLENGLEDAGMREITAEEGEA
jgi:hypothetical protein